MTSKRSSNPVGNGALASEEDLSENNPELSRMIVQVMQRVLNPNGELPVGGVSRETLRDQPEREKALEDFVLALMPTGVNPDLWMGWLNGGEAPFVGSRLAHPDPDGQSISRATERQLKKVRRTNEKLAAARKSAEVANRKLAAAEKIAAVELSFDAGLIQYAVSDHLMKLISPVFAMGPAWTLMRSVSAHLDDEILERDLKAVIPEKRAEFAARFRDDREKSSELILRVLDQWAADPEFESELHDAIYELARKFDVRDVKPRKARSTQALRKSVQVEAKRDAAQVIAGLSTGKP